FCTAARPANRNSMRWPWLRANKRADATIGVRSALGQSTRISAANAEQAPAYAPIARTSEAAAWVRRALKRGTRRVRDPGAADAGSVAVPRSVDVGLGRRRRAFEEVEVATLVRLRDVARVQGSVAAVIAGLGTLPRRPAARQLGFRD